MYVLNRYRHVLDAELQQRACEYVALANMPNDELLQAVCEEMPPFAEKSCKLHIAFAPQSQCETSAALLILCNRAIPTALLLSRLHRKHGDTEDKRTWIIGGKEVNRGREEARNQSLKKGLANGGAMPTGGPAPTVVPAGGQPNGVTANANSATTNNPDRGMSAQDEIMAGLSGLDLSAPSTLLIPSGEATDSQVAASQPLIPGADTVISPLQYTTPPLTATTAQAAVDAPVAKASSGPPLTHGTEKYYRRLCYTSEGVLFEDSQLQIGVKSEYHGHLGRVALYLGNKITVGFTSLTVTVEPREPDALSVTLPKIPTSTLGGMTQVQQVVQLECKDFFREPPILRISYLAGSMQELVLRLPVPLTKFIEPVQLTQNDFFERWKQIGGAPREAQKIFAFKLNSAGEVDVQRHRKLVGGARFQVLEGIDPNPINIVGAGVLHMSTTGKVGCLLRLEPNKEAKVSPAFGCALHKMFSWLTLSVSPLGLLFQLCRLTVRTTNEDVSEQIMQSLSQALS